MSNAESIFVVKMTLTKTTKNYAVYEFAAAPGAGVGSVYFGLENLRGQPAPREILVGVTAARG